VPALQVPWAFGSVHVAVGKVHCAFPGAHAPAHSPVPPQAGLFPRGWPEATCVHEPREPARSHASQGAEQSRLQQTPSAEQKPVAQSSGRLQALPFGTLPQRLATQGAPSQSLSVAQALAQAVPAASQR
jgi:hypothetical protein